MVGEHFTQIFYPLSGVTKNQCTAVGSLQYAHDVCFLVVAFKAMENQVVAGKIALKNKRTVELKALDDIVLYPFWGAGSECGKRDIR